MAETRVKSGPRPLRRRLAYVALGKAFLSTLKPGSPGPLKRLGALPRMIGATLRGAYDGGLRLFGMAVAIVYIVSPVDLVPEAFLLFFGLVDDALVAVWLAGAVLDETARFLDWEKRSRFIEGQLAGAQR